MSWTLERAQAHLLSREQFGMRLGLERISALLEALGSPQHELKTIHVVGSNGKSSTARYAAALLRAGGLRAGAYLSPHLVSFAERVWIGGRDCPPESFARGVQVAAEGAARLEAGRAPDDRVTQFELLTAAGLWILAEARVEVAAVEAGLGGRLDATNVLAAPVVGLTSVSLEHTDLLGETVAEIAREKVAVAGPGATLVVGGDVPAAARAVAAERARAVGARLVDAPPLPAQAGAGLAGYQRANLAVAAAAAEALAGPLPAGAVDRAAQETVPGRLQVAGREPLVVLDGAHNPGGVAAALDALAHRLPGVAPVAVVGILADKDAEAMLAPLLAASRAAVLTASDSPRALAPAALAGIAARVAPEVPTEVVAEPAAALERARELAGRDGCVLACGSLTLVGELLRARDRVGAAA